MVVFGAVREEIDQVMPNHERCENKPRKQRERTDPSRHHMLTIAPLGKCRS